jgi:methionyl-tRNA formyltransferase
MKTLIITDNAQTLEFAKELQTIHGLIDVFQSPGGPLSGVPRLDLRASHLPIGEQYGLIISIHCKQLFPPELIKRVRCVNIHPGFNPFNRGWFPQVFSIINGMKAGVTIHEIDEKLDHGPIIVQREYQIRPWDTSGSAYANIMKIERELLLEHYPSIRTGSYSARPTQEEGNVNYKRDFEDLKRIDLDRRGCFRDFLNHIRALTHGDHRNAYFTDERGRKVFVRIVLDPDNSQQDPSGST